MTLALGEKAQELVGAPVACAITIPTPPQAGVGIGDARLEPKQTDESAISPPQVGDKPINYCCSAPTKSTDAVAGEDLVWVKKYLIDTGCGYDLICRGNIQDANHADIYTLPGEGVSLYTANDPITCTERIDQRVHRLGETAQQMVVQNTPDLLSVGWRCQEKGYGFVWEPYSNKPYLLKPNSKGKYYKVLCDAENYTPFLYDYEVGRCL